MSGWIWLIILVLDVCALITLWMVPQLTAYSLLMGVYVPEYDRNLSAVLAIRRKYRLGFIASSVVGLVVGLIVYPVSEDHFRATFGLLIATQLAGIMISLVVCRHLTLQLKVAQQWVSPVETTRRVADLQFRQASIVIRSRWFLIPMLMVTFCVGIAIVRWSAIPDILTVHHYGFFGWPVRLTVKTIGSVFLPNFLQITIILLVMGINIAFEKSKQQLNPHRPEISRSNQVQFRRLNSIFLMVFCLLVVALMGYVQMEMLFTWTQNGIVLAFTLVTLLLTGGFIGFLIYLHQKGLAHPDESKVRVDRLWLGGLFYRNRKDRPLFVAKRYGIGWTVNFAHPLSWVLVGVLLVLVVLGLRSYL